LTVGPVRQGKSITLIAAMARNRAIGVNGAMPWHLPGELQHFKAATMGKPIVMGRKTWESIGRPLPGRQNIVVTRNPGFRAEGCDLAVSLDEAIDLANGEEIMIIGGGQLYAQALPDADRMLLTLVDCEPDADTWFPPWDRAQWRLVSRRQEASDNDNPLSYEVLELVRRSGGDESAPAPETAGGPPAAAR
jgi:dihydrofolate reductase